ncbi:XrtA/PEP-CTERM system exopolysaccharide export protein [Marinobacter sp. X15-166B]|uniref:XrtA/PEP-CTERM system exopolysaccharide export protein n=1 Tax=Marinobacter sp. X15-166B TaxID=1897620 RepID=UPI00085C3A21|nr:XrtA/PEP-CTERM system exopolysaccharide export protein [Marinobacter sp. X15-166B]OEY67762.1 sugar ABC transporter substrate-binding protein [Marinobacter sp. X15-166B]
MSRIVTLKSLVLALVSVVLLSACAIGSSPSSPEKIQNALNYDSTNSVDDYVIGVTDVLAISVWRNNDLSITVPVRPDGKISVPLIGDVAASGQTPEDLSADLERKLARYVREPKVSVVVTSMGSHEFSDRVRVTGAVRQPMSVPHRAGMTVLDIFLSAGGANPFAALNNTMLYRSVDGEVVAIPVRLDDILNKGRVQTNYAIRPGDILAVPERSF